MSETLKTSLEDAQALVCKTWQTQFPHVKKSLAECRQFIIRGRVQSVSGTIIRARISDVKIGELCRLVDPVHGSETRAEVVGLDSNIALLSPLGNTLGISNNTEVVPTGTSFDVEVGDHLLGSVLNGLGEPIQKGPDYDNTEMSRTRRPVLGDSPDPMQRQLISKPISLGIKALDAVLSCGEGQRFGIFAAAGGGKSTLLGMMIRNAEVDVTVIALIGERGREVREFLDHDLGPEGRKKAVVCVSTSDRPAMERVKVALVATTIAEYYRDQGKKVLLLMDSVTRYARALREIGLSAGEPPTRRGFPPSVFAALPQLMERAGNSANSSITACYTVLVEGDDMTEPVADETRSILDGHVILSRELAASAHYPAIDILASTSRVMNNFVSNEHKKAAMRLRNLLAKYKEVELLVRIGEYQKGNDAEADKAVAAIEKIKAFLQQPTHTSIPFTDSVRELQQLMR
ncbi:MAG: type III secretion system ATPase SctN [Alteromonadaceae bacterium]|nr:type III secretion system ATPase SctN [Alteromonadaceae bacterium]